MDSTYLLHTVTYSWRGSGHLIWIGLNAACRHSLHSHWGRRAACRRELYFSYIITCLHGSFAASAISKILIPYWIWASLILFYEGGELCPTPKSYSQNFNLVKVAQKCYQICAINLFSWFFSTKQFINKSRDLPMTSLSNSPSIPRSNSHKIKSAVNWCLRTKF